MTTDITELAQREKFEAWFKSSFHPDKTGPYIKDQLYFAWKAAGAELVEALEKAQATEAHCNRGWIEAHEQEARAEAAEQRIAELESRTVTAAAADVLAERQRQVTAEGWTAERDDGYQNSELADAAACYAIHAHNQGFSTPAHWPWSQDWWKQTSPRRDLVKAGALILAEIERLDRADGIKVEAE
ncbi:hypothetical protein [Klebsiella variicola]|uniref:hypothetical protein n=1 Tax=Klebsiella variicola TaxID=244366 RepID=UPI000E2B08D6|nr:Uncharacterised protein [Klebsiella variicola]